MPTSLAPLRATFLSTFLVFNLLALTSALSWYDKGHRIVGLIAQANLTPTARRGLERILPETITRPARAIGPDHEGGSIRVFDPFLNVRIPGPARGYDQDG